MITFSIDRVTNDSHKFITAKAKAIAHEMGIEWDKAEVFVTVKNEPRRCFQKQAGFKTLGARG